MDRYDLVAQGANDGLWDWDLVTGRMHFSARWNAILGFDEDAAGNTPEGWFERVHIEDLDQVKHEIDRCLADGSSKFEVQHRMLHKDGSCRWMSCRGVIMRNKAGEAVRIAGSHSDITAEKIADSLTGLPNRLLILNRLARSIEAAQTRSGYLFAVIILDIGIPEGIGSDPLVIAAARRLETCLRAKHAAGNLGRDYVVARSGGDEFIILAEDLTSPDEAKILAELLLKELFAPFQINDVEVFLSPSSGIALSVTDYKNAESALRDADTALYRAKSLGKGRCEVFDTSILDAARNSLKLETDLKRALERQEFFLVYQPIVRLDSREIAGFEALLRWKHPERGQIPPTEFIPIAEKTGLIVPLGMWVLGEACRQLKLWKENPHLSRDLYVTVNITPVQLRQPFLVNEISEILRNPGSDAEGLVLELTESGVMENPDAANRTLMQLRVMGARLAIDDFGTGYSSLSRLCRFPLDFIKIDRSFVMGLKTSRDARDVVQTICELAHTLGLRLIAEGIETRDQLDAVRSLGCEYGQGYFFSRPIGSGEAEELLKHGFPQMPENSQIPDRDEGNPAGDAAEKKIQKPGAARKHFLIAAAGVILILTAGVLVRFKPVPSKPSISAGMAKLSPGGKVPENKEAPEHKPLKTPEKPKPSSRPAPAATQVPSAGKTGLQADSLPKTTKKGSAIAEYTCPVAHDHRLGGCKGILKVTRDAISFISENSKCNFSMAHSACSYDLSSNRLTIKTSSKKYRFKSSNAAGDQENYAQLDGIVKRIFEMQRK